MKILNLSFQESQYIVDKSFVQRHTGESVLKRFWGIFVLSVFIYSTSLIFPLIFNYLSNHGEVKNFNSWNYLVIVLLIIVYFLYCGLSIVFRRDKFIKKYLTTLFLAFTAFYMMVILVFISFMLTYMYFHLLLAILMLVLLLVVAVYSLSKLRQGIIDSAKKEEVFNSVSHIATEKVTRGLIILGGSGITAIGAIINLSTGGEFNRIFNIILSPFLGFLGYFLVYFFLVEVIKGYYILKYRFDFNKVYSEFG